MKIYNICINKKNHISKVISIFLIIFILSYFLIFSKYNYKIMSDIVDIFIYIVVPSLFPFILFSNILIYSNYFSLLSDTMLVKLMKKFFKTTKLGGSAILFGFLFGYPNGARYVNELYENNKISYKEAEYLMMFINNSSPAFILSSIGIGIFDNIKIGVIFLFSHLISSILIGKFISMKNKKKNSYIGKEDKTHFQYETSLSFETVTNAIRKTIFTMCMILGFMTIFILLHSILFKVLNCFSISNKYISSFILGIFELTSGINNMSVLTLDFKLMIIILSFLLGFSSLSIIFQIYSCVYRNKFKLSNIIKSKIYHGILSGIITYILLNVPIIYEYISMPQNANYNIFSNMYLNNIHPHFVTFLILIISISLIFIFTKKKRLKIVSIKGG